MVCVRGGLQNLLQVMYLHQFERQAGTLIERRKTCVFFFFFLATGAQRDPLHLSVGEKLQGGGAAPSQTHL